jgi:hypothetical protein
MQFQQKVILKFLRILVYWLKNSRIRIKIMRLRQYGRISTKILRNYNLEIEQLAGLKKCSLQHELEDSSRHCSLYRNLTRCW